MTNKQLTEQLIHDFESFKKEVRTELGLMRDDFNDFNIEFTAFKQESILTRKNDNNIKKDLKDEIQIANMHVVAKVDSKIDEVTDMIEDKKVVHYKKPWFTWFNKKRG